MRKLVIGLMVSMLPMQLLLAQQTPAPSTETIRTAASHMPTEQQIIDLSNSKWNWMADKKVDALAALFDDRAMFTHMGGTWNKIQELAMIKKRRHLVQEGIDPRGRRSRVRRHRDRPGGYGP